MWTLKFAKQRLDGADHPAGAVVAGGCSTVANISAATRVGTGCDSCAEELQD